MKRKSKRTKKSSLRASIQNKAEQVRQIRVPVEKVILYGAATYAAYNMGMAGGYIEGTHISIGGLVAGTVINLSLAIASSKYGSLTGKNRTKQAQMAFISILGLNVIITAPVVFYKLPDTFLNWWWLRAIWSAVWPLTVDVAIVLAGAVAGGSLISLSKPSEQKSDEKPAKKAETAEPQPATSQPQPATIPLEPAKTAIFCPVAGCERNQANPEAEPFGSQSALNAHQRKHKPIAVSFEPAQKEAAK